MQTCKVLRAVDKYSLSFRRLRRFQLISYSVQTSKHLNSFIETSIRLRYKVELALDGLEDGPSHMATTERLRAIYKRREALRSMRSFDYNRCFVLSPETIETFTGTHFASMDLQGNVEVLRVPSTLCGIREDFRRWKVPRAHSDGQSIRTMKIDPRQDLFVLVRHS